jgi:CRP/FNR family cyclic AMP-dependent transcriptional regulator
MPCPPNELRHVPLFSLLDDDEIAVLSGQVELRTFAARQRIYKLGDIDGRAFILLTGEVVVSTVDEDGQEVVVQQPVHGEFFGFASMLEATAHVTTAVATEESTCLEIDRHDITVLLTSKPMAGLDMMSVLARQWHQSQDLIRVRAARNPNMVIDEKETMGERVADRVASFGGSWTFIIAFGVVLSVYTAINVALRGKAWDPYPFILLNLFLSMLAAIQAPVIMMSQNRQDKKDRVRSELDFDVNVRAESEIQALSRRMKELHDKLDDVDEHLRTGRE